MEFFANTVKLSAGAVKVLVEKFHVHLKQLACVGPPLSKGSGSKVHIAVDTLGHLLAIKVTPADEQARAQVGELAAHIQEATGDTVELARVDQGYTGQQPAQDAAVHGIRLDVVKLSEAKKGFVLLPRRWVVERSFGWAARFKRLSRDYERLASTLTALHWLAFVMLMLPSAIKS